MLINDRQRKAARNSLNLLKLRNGKGGRGLYSSFLNSFKKNQNKKKIEIIWNIIKKTFKWEKNQNHY